MTDDLVTWLRAIYDERERTAVASGGRGPTGQWHAPDGEMWAGRVEDGAGNIVVYDEGSPTEAQAAHIADNDPAGTLAEVDAKRRILDRHVPWQSGFRWIDQQTRVPDVRCTVCHEIPADVDYDNPPYAVPWPCPEILDAAAPHADRPGYREAWRP